MEQGIYLEMTEVEYHQAPGQHSTQLARFRHSPDHALMPVEPKSYFTIGHAFEAMIRDRATGSTFFDQKFFRSRCPGTVPDALLGLVESGADLNQYYVHTKAGELNKTYKSRHAFMDECQENPGKMPLSSTDFAMLEKMADNFFNLELYGLKIADLLTIARFQVPIFWQDDFGIEKKALVDVLIESENIYVWDIKTSASEAEFTRLLKSRYFIQDQHYTEGAIALFGHALPMKFLVSYKQEPYLAQARGIEAETREVARGHYMDLCQAYDRWEKAGKPAKGCLPYREDKIWF